MTRIKVVISITIDGQQYFNIWPGFGYWTDDLKNAKIYSGRPKSKVAELKYWVEHIIVNTPISAGPKIGLMVNGQWADEHIVLTKDIVKTVKLHELLFYIREL